MTRKAKGLGMISGGLDSLLAVAVLRQQGIEVKGLHFLNGYSPRNLKKRVYEKMPVEKIAEERRETLSAALGIDVDVIDVSEEFLEVMKDPPHGFGKNVNPCIDCRIFLLTKARERLVSEGADFIFTGEVLGQRP
ncbi:MAG TPA: hypothetical protein VLA34_02615, partial [Candidatus Krumholzibacterium sp.]|nr:hypothetical protein [Candidatus Krumholzibacterium sp.]